MNFSDFFKSENNVISEDDEHELHMQKEKPKKKTKDIISSVENILIDNDIKIKTLIPTHFGVEIILAKKYSDSEIKKILDSYKIQIKDNSIFVEF